MKKGKNNMKKWYEQCEKMVRTMWENGMNNVKNDTNNMIHGINDVRGDTNKVTEGIDNMRKSTNNKRKCMSNMRNGTKKCKTWYEQCEIRYE